MEVIDYILDTHHTFMREVLDEHNSLVFKVLKVHFKGHGDPMVGSYNRMY
jgi:iron-sulfur cluster repair protein YtfE (RIC family)